MDDAKAAYMKDSRIPCRYGLKCYQKNPVHQNKYKHPPDPKRKKTFTNVEGNQVKRPKPNDSNGYNSKTSEIGEKEDLEAKQAEKTNLMISNDVSESDSEEEIKPNDGSNGNSKDVIGNEKHQVRITNDVSESESEEEMKNSVDNEDKAELRNLGDEVHPKSKIATICDHQNGHNQEFSKKFIKDKFLLEMPEDFYQFYNLCERLNKKNPCEALSNIGLKLVGPYDVLSGKFCGVEIKDEDYLIHWRYFHDPPEMQTILKGDDKTGYHIGYFRDTPEEKPVFMVENHAMKDGILTAIGENVFAAVSLFLEDRMKTADPFKKLNLNKISKIVMEEAKKLGLDMSRKTKRMSMRNNKVLTRTFNKVGLVVPYERKTQLGYRKLAMSEKELDALLTNIQKAHPEQKQKLLGELQSEVLTWTDIASDECDFGTGIELGWNIICHGVEDLNHTASRFLASNFRQLKWEAFAKIAEAHMANRKKGCDLSII